ncbi:TPA: CA_C0660 family putative sactipeptide bacteriocin [Clostridium botulinum]|nr:CA_C0660 family putative sactipeptide bacteriocin [Clostridium botulinum]
MKLVNPVGKDTKQFDSEAFYMGNCHCVCSSGSADSKSGAWWTSSCNCGCNGTSANNSANNNGSKNS